MYEKIIEIWQSYNISSAAGIDKYLCNFKVLFAYNSGKIENPEINYHDTREVFENGRVCSFTGSVRTLFEQQNQKDCYEILQDKIINKEEISLDLIKAVHFELCKGTYDERRYLENGEKPGEFKKHDYVVGLNEVGSDAEEVEDDLRELIEEVNNQKDGDILKIAAYFHANFENIHPFADGNGRVGRTLLNYYLMIKNHPPIIIYDEDKKIYYEALKIFDERLNIDDLYVFFKQQCVKTWKRILN
jgi:Fic family protein